jgi:hyaluronoglucosaminidase
MSITMSGASALQNEINSAFWADKNLTELTIDIVVTQSNPTKTGGFTLNASRLGAMVTATIGTSEESSIRYALNALLKWIEGANTSISLDDGPDFSIRGVVEGFYGKAWSHQQRLRGLKHFGDFNMNAYFMAPKDVPWQRFNWRAAFDSQFLDLTHELIQTGRLNAIEIAVCVSPGLSVKYSDQEDVLAVVRRYKQLFVLGARHFGLLWDDIAWELTHPEDIESYESTAAAHADFTNRVWVELMKLDSHISLTVCPMHYSGRGNEPYLQEIGRKLHSRINLMWTGRSICSEYLDISDAVIFERTTMRPPLYWDNFPVNDGSMQKSLFIGPVRGREVGLQKYSVGLLSNPMLQFEMSQFPLFTIGDYLWNSTDYDPDQSWESSLVHLIANEKDRLALRSFMRTSMGTVVGGDPAPDLRAVFRLGVTAWRAGDLARSGDVFISAGQEMIENHTYLNSPSFSRPEMILEISQWLEKYLIGAEVLVGLGHVLKSCGFDAKKGAITGSQMQIAELGALIESLQAHRKNLFGDQIEGPINELMAELASF